MTAPHSSSPLSALISRIDAAVSGSECAQVCAQIKSALEDASRAGSLNLPAAMITPVEGSYGRHLLHRDPDSRYTIVVMCWGPEQGTPIHDHAGLWCVECVVRGRIRVHSYQLVEEPAAGQVRFAKEEEVVADIGEAGALIPPYEYHVIENPEAAIAVTMHVYGGEMSHCNIYEPIDGASLHRRETRELCYTSEATSVERAR